MADEEYNRKLETLQQYIPFLDNMIAQLKDPSKKNREQQLNKMQSLHAMITDKRKKLKLETLVKCEDVISKLYEKVHNKPISLKKGFDCSSTPASPSPPREIITPNPLTIPTERLDEIRIPKVDIYSSAAESLSRPRVCQELALGGKVPDMSKPPISLEDLKTLEDDVQEKINESALGSASLFELNNLKEKLTEQIEMEDVLLKSPQKNKKDELESINTTVRNNLNLTKKLIQPPDKSKSKEISKSSPCKPLESSCSTLSPKKEHKSVIPSVNKSPKILKEPDSIFGSILSHIDHQILDIKKKKEERRNSLNGKDENKLSDKDTKKRDRKRSTSKEDDGKKDNKDTKKKESNSTEDKSKTKDEKKSKGGKESDSKKKERHHQSGDKGKSKDDKKQGESKEGQHKKEDKRKHSSKGIKDNVFSLSGKKTFEAEEERLKQDLENKTQLKETNGTKKNNDIIEIEDDGDGDKDIIGKISVKKDLGQVKTSVVDKKEEELNKPPTFKRLADKYRPKPRKTTAEPDIDKELSDIIEEKMKTTPPKIPVINQIPAPIPPPESLLLCCQAEPEEPEPAPKLPTILQNNMLDPSTTQLINTVVRELRQNNAESEARKTPLLPTPTENLDNFVSEYTRDNFVSEYTREDFVQDDFTQNNMQMSDFNNFQTSQMRQERLSYEPPPPVLNNQFNQIDHQNQRFMSPNENFTPKRSFTPLPQGFSQPYANFQPDQAIQNTPADMQPLDYYPPNAPIPSNQYNCGPPLLSPEVPHFHTEQKPANYDPMIGMMPNHDPFGHEDMRWRQEEGRFSWDRRDQDFRVNRDPRTYREYRELRESRDPRVANRDPRDNPRDPRTMRDPRVNRDLRDNRDPREHRDPRDRDQREGRDSRDRDFRDRDHRDRDPRLNKDRDYDRDRSRFRDSRSQTRETRPNRYDSKFDRMYSRTNRDRSRSRSRYSKETFMSPLDSLYTGKEEHKTGKGYGVQNFRIPKIKKEEEGKEQSTKISSTNEDVCDVHSVNDDSNGSTNEVTGNEIDTEEVEAAGENAEVTKKGEGNENEKDIIEKEREIEKKEEFEKKAVEVENSEPPKLDNEVEESKSVETPKPIPQLVEPDQAKPADQTILAQFFANLLGSQNKKQKKTALYSLISTFSDSFSEKELTKITKIIKADDDEADTSEEEEEVKKPEQKPETETTKEPEKETLVEETQLDDNCIKTTKRKCRKRIRRISSTPSLKDEKNKEEEVVKAPEPPEIPYVKEESVIVTVGERIKSRKRASITPPKPKKKCKTELDMLHEDIQDMFIRDGVLTASGKRMCRLLKSDPNALSTPQTTSTEPQKIRKKPGPKPRKRLNSSEMKTMRNVRILLPKIPDSSIEQKEESPRRTLRSSTKPSYAESDEDDNSVAAEEGSVLEEESDAESTDTEKDKTQTTDSTNKTKAIKRKRGKGWASGIIPTNRRKKKKQMSAEESADKSDAKDSSTCQADVDKSFVEPDKNYYIDFATSKSHECKLCDYQGRFITTHYKMQHPESEILTSRFSPAVAQEAIEDSTKNLAKYESLLRIQGSGRFHFTCRFCAFNTTVAPTIFYDHITTHTGEYRHICPTCDFSAPNGKTLKSHMSSVHNNVDKRVVRKSYSQTIIFGYLCGECNYVQVTRKNVEDHINIFHLQKPKIYKVNMSTTLDPEVVKVVENESKKDRSSPAAVSVEEGKNEEDPISSHNDKKNKVKNIDKEMLPPQIKQRSRPGPKCMKDKWRAKAKKVLADRDGSASDSSSVAGSESSNSTEPEKVFTPEQSPVKPVGKKRLSREVSVSSEEDLIISGRSRRVAKDKATEKLKTLMELTENGGRKKSLSSAGDEEKNRREGAATKRVNEQTDAKVEVKTIKADQKPLLDKKEELPKIKKEVELNVFTCKTDIQEENKKIQQERLQLMEELNKSVGSRTSLNFVDKLCNRLSKNDIIVKEEPKDDLIDTIFQSNTKDPPPPAMPILEKNLPTRQVPPDNESAVTKALCTATPPPKKPVLQTEDIHVSNPSFDVTQKNDKLITDMIQKLKGKLANFSDDKSENSTTMEDADYDSEGPPPLTHVHELPNVKPADGSTKTLLIGGLMKVIKYPTHLMFSCLVPPCVFSTENKDIFKNHCSEAHKQQDRSTLCEMCGMEIVSTQECTLLENIFKHALQEHADFINSTELKPDEKKDFVKPPNRLLRIRKLSGDALSIKKDWEEEIDNSLDVSAEVEKEGTNKEKQCASTIAEVAVRETETAEEHPTSIVELDMSDDNPFPFKIAGVMSLAEPLPPLAPIVAKPALQMVPNTQLIVKEAKLTQAELSKPRKTPKAMAKFISSVSDLYKCPHYYCLFSTNFRDFLERHLKAHKVESDVMIPCVYCDMKTPWEHVPMHIDIRHAHCRFACSYCLYRAVVKEYVFMHQDQMHPENDYSVIALPQPKHSKKWAIADVKVDPKNLCEPYRCTVMCAMEFLFENEFRRHLHNVHKSNFIPCGYKNCLHRVQANKMTNHWALTHGISIYQCGCCKINNSEIKKLYHHFAQFHQGAQPDILIRLNAEMKDGVYLGYTPEAFSYLRKVVTIPSNVCGENKSDVTPGESPAVPVMLPATVPYAMPTKATLQVVTSLPQNVATKSLIIPASKSVINHTITFVSTNSATTSGSNIVFVPTVTSCTTLSGIVMSPQASTQIMSVAPVGKTLKVIPSTSATAVPVPAVQEVPSRDAASETVDDTNTEKDGEANLAIEPLEHVTVTEDHIQSNDETDTVEADPLSLDTDAEADMNDASKADSSGDESDGTKLEKSKKDAKSGLMSYQLYRCAFCDISFSNSMDFKRHATYSMTCRKEAHIAKPFVCVHCEKQLKNPHVLVEHIQVHGILRITCSLCGCKFPTIAQTRSHMKNRHNVTHTSMTPLNPAKQNMDIDEYVVRPKLQIGAVKEALNAEPSAVCSLTEDIYTPETVDKIPMRHILGSTAKCGICSYSTKVRTNMVRHLQFHSEEKAVPDTAPVNPVPCLEKNEKMFDKMINLASSSHANSRMGGAKADAKEKEAENYPEFIPSHCRYVCCAHGCSYICPEEGNLRHHLIALHDGETSFTCVHCKANLTPTDADNLIKHFKLHGLQLYKCQYCAFMHNLKHKVEKHSSDSHLDLPVKVITVRFMESEPKDVTEEPSTSNAPSAPAPAPSGKYYKPWRCCMCKYKSGTQQGIQNHVSEKHEIESQFKCALCSYKTDDKETFTDHFKVTHDSQTVDIIHGYRKLEEDKEKEPETFDTTPLWQRDRPRVRHIRGILFDESSPVVNKSPKKSKSATAAPSPGPSGARSAAPSPGPSGVKPVTPSPGTKPTTPSSASNTSKNHNVDLSIESVVNGTADILREQPPAVSDDFFHTVNKMMKDSNEDIAKVRDSMVIVIEDEEDPKTPTAKNKDNKNAPVAKNRVVKRKGIEVPGISKIPKISEDIIDLESSGSDTEQDEYSERNLRLQFGGFGTPLWKQLKCPVCNMFKSKRISDFVFHLFKEMKIFRFKCKVCTDESITYRYMHKHIRDHHAGSKDYKDDIIPLAPNEKLLTWLQMVIREQSIVIMKNYPKVPLSATASCQNPVQCDFCEEKFRTEQEKNEHSIIHWTMKPYCCYLCSYTAYLAADIKKHFKADHQSHVWKTVENEVALAKGPTVEKLLKISDDQHVWEAEGRLPKADASTNKEPEARDPLGDVADQTVDPLDVSGAAAHDDVPEKGDDAVLSDSDLIIVTKTDTNVPTESDLYCCEYCAYMANSEVQMLSHITSVHEHMSINFKILNRVTCDNPKDHVGCTICAEVGSEVKIRQHHMEKHKDSGVNFSMYRFQCALCKQKRFLKFAGLRVHFNKIHPGSQLKYTSLYNASPCDAVASLKTYKCPICPYERNLKPNSVYNMRQHLKLHFKAFMCALCLSTKYKARADVVTHYVKEHPGVEDHKVFQDFQVLDNYNATMAAILAAATDVPVVEAPFKNTARKSTSAPQASSTAPEYSFYGNKPEDVDLSKIMTSVEVNGMHLDMSAEKLAKIFDLNVVVAVEDCNLSVNLSNVFDS